MEETFDDNDLLRPLVCYLCFPRRFEAVSKRFQRVLVSPFSSLYIYVWIYENSVKEIKRFLFFLLLFLIFVLFCFVFAFPMAAACKSYLA